MFNKIRIQLTLLHMLIAVMFVVVIGGVTYELLNYYFQNTTDLALRHKMAHEYEFRKLPLPTELDIADRQWVTLRQQALSLPWNNRQSVTVPSGDDESTEYAERREADGDDSLLEEAYDGELSAIFLLRLDAQGRLLDAASSPILPDPNAVQSALVNGNDLRTVQLASGARVRWLSYRLPADSDATILQLGRVLSDQDRILSRLLWGISTVAVGVAALSSLTSWWLAGRALQPAQAAFERQRTFVANASHELRSPLTFIRATAEVAQMKVTTGGSPQNSAVASALADVIDETDHMTRLVNDLLLLSRLDAGQLKLEKQTLAVGELLQEVARRVASSAHERGVTIAINSGDETLVADRTRLRQVLLILLDNALRSTARGGRVLLSSGQSDHTVWIVVADNGVGIAAEHLSHIFERFYRVDNVPGNNGNAGLGLSIAKSLVEAHRGRITIESQVGDGTVVRLAFHQP